MKSRVFLFFIIFLGISFTNFSQAQNKQKVEIGYAEMIPATNNGKYQALHKTAPIGTVITVRNSYNNASIQVKVIGRLPNTGNNEKLIIKLSEAAFRHLNGRGDRDKRFGVELSYVTF